MVSRSQWLTLVFLGLAWLSLLVILVVAPDVYAQALQLPPGNTWPVEVGFLAALTGFIGLLAFGTLKRWRWAFWLLLVANLFGVLRVPAAGLQFIIGLVMLADYRRAGVWGTRALSE